MKAKSNIETDSEIPYNMYMDETTEPPVEDEVIGSKVVNKYKTTISYVEEELYTTLNYLNNQLDVIDVQVGGDDPISGTVVPFNRNVYDSKKQIVEQKIIALRTLASIASEQVKVTSGTKEGEITNITDLFQ